MVRLHLVKCYYYCYNDCYCYYMLLDIRASSPPPRRRIHAFAYFFPVHLRFAKRVRCPFDGRSVKRILFKKQIKYAEFYCIEFITRSSEIIRIYAIFIYLGGFTLHRVMRFRIFMSVPKCNINDMSMMT